MESKEYKIEGTIRNPPPIPKYPEAKESRINFIYIDANKNIHNY